MKSITIKPSKSVAPTKAEYHSTVPEALPEAKETKIQPSLSSSNTAPNASLFFVGTATTILQYSGLRILTDPNFLHAGDHVHLGPGVSSTRRTNPALDIDELPRIDLVLLSHYHEDHFDKEVEKKLSRQLPIITTPHAKGCLEGSKEGKFTEVTSLDTWESGVITINEGTAEDAKVPSIKVTAMPGKHVPPGPLNVVNEMLGAVPPTNGWMLELGTSSSASSSDDFESGYRIYISGDTLFVDDLKAIPERYKDQNIDLMLIHLGGTTIPGPSMPLLMVTMDAKQGVQLMQLVNPDVTIPIHYDDYEVFLSPLEDFKKAVKEAGLADKVVYLDRKDEYKFSVPGQ